MRNIKETKRAQEAEISRYKKIDILNCLLFSDSFRIASVELFRDVRTLLRQFYITK